MQTLRCAASALALAVVSGCAAELPGPPGAEIEEPGLADGQPRRVTWYADGELSPHDTATTTVLTTLFDSTADRFSVRGKLIPLDALMTRPFSISLGSPTPGIQPRMVLLRYVGNDPFAERAPLTAEIWEKQNPWTDSVYCTRDIGRYQHTMFGQLTVDPIARTLTTWDGQLSYAYGDCWLTGDEHLGLYVFPASSDLVEGDYEISVHLSCDGAPCF